MLMTLNCSCHFRSRNVSLLYYYIIIAAMNDNLIKLRNWCFDNRLLLNPDKTKLIVYGNQKMILKLQDFCLPLLGKELLPIDSVKDLGVVFDSKLSFNDHAIKTVSSRLSALGQISQVKHVLIQERHTYYNN